MKVRDLISALEQLPKESEVWLRHPGWEKELTSEDLLWEVGLFPPRERIIIEVERFEV